MPLEDGETRPDYPRPPCAPSFIKLGLIPILHQCFTHSLYVYAGETIMPPRVLASGPKPCGGNKTIIRFGFCDTQNNQGLGKCYQPQPAASADNPYLDLDYSGYHKNLIQ